jgi:hypothetical protein
MKHDETPAPSELPIGQTITIWREADDLIIMHVGGIDLRLSEELANGLLDDLTRVCARTPVQSGDKPNIRTVACPECKGAGQCEYAPCVAETCHRCGGAKQIQVPAEYEPFGSCLICGQLAPFVVWSGTVGACERCRNLALRIQ